MAAAHRRPLVTIKREAVEDVDAVKKEPQDATATSSHRIMLATTTSNNNNTAGAGEVTSCLIRIKQEVVDIDDGDGDEAHAGAPKTIEVLSAFDKETITIKAEPRADVEEDVSVDVESDLDDVEDDEESDVEDDECEFDEDDSDLDFDPDSSDSGNTPDSEMVSADTSGSPDSAGTDIDIMKDEDSAEGSDGSEKNSEEKKSFDFNGMTIETTGNYSKCPKCEKNIKSTFIIRHIKLHDVPVERYECPEKNCDLQVNRINNLFRHLKAVHRSKKPYMCKQRSCSARFARAQQLRSHLATHREERRLQRGGRGSGDGDHDDDDDRDGGRVYACEFPGCEKEYKKRHHLKEHERKHTGDQKYSCEVCGKRFYIQAHMKRHLYSHTGIKPHVCRWKCGAIFASYGGRMKHERINHYDRNPLQSDCDICGRPFKNTQQLSKHRMTHLNPEERKDYRCSFCHIMFDTIKLRERHEERHKDGEIFSCETCGKVFKNEKNLTHHVKAHHLKKEASKPKKESPRLHCHICGPPKMYCLTSLRRHLARIHSTNYKCPRDDCGKCFKEKAQLDAHVEIHRLRECHLCGKKFQRKQNADIHLVGVHGMTKDDLANLGRWNPKKDTENCPEYMTRKTNVSFKKFRQKKRALSNAVPGEEGANEGEGESRDDSAQEELVDFITVDEMKQEPVDSDDEDGL